MTLRLHPAHERFAAWCAPLFSVVTIGCFLGLARFYHPVSGSASPAAIGAFFARHHLAVEWGMSLFALACVILALYTIELTITLWRREASPLYSFGQLLGGFAVVMLIFISCCLWIAAAYRAGHTNPQITQSLNDLSWFGFLVGWVMLALQMASTGAVVLTDRGATPLAPRWAGWASVIGAAALATANGCAFAKSGVFGWNGVLGFYLPMAIWGVWLNSHAALVLRDLRRRSLPGAVTPSTVAERLVEPIPG